MRVFTDLLGEELQLSEADRYRLRWAALMHDIGKLTIAPKILNKPGALDEHEWRLMKGHPVEGARIAEPILGWLGPWADAIVEHHERFDGKGYPNGLAGGSISLGGRIVSVADSYDTMTAARSYKKPMAVWTARRELADCAGGQFDPEIVRAFLSISLPKLLWRTGPVTLAVQLPFLGRLQEVGLQSVTAMTQGVAAATVAAGVTAMVVAGPTGASAHGHHTRASAGGGANTTSVATAAVPHGDPARTRRVVSGTGRSHAGTADAEPGTGRPFRGSIPDTRARHAEPGPTEPGRPEPTPRPTPVPTPTPTPRPSPTPTPRPSPLPLPLPSEIPLPIPGVPPLPIPTLPPLPLPSLPPLPRPSLPPLPIPRPLALLPVETLDIED